MRTYGRLTDEFGVKTWVVVETDANGFNDMVYLTTLIQTLKLSLGEDPFNANYGIPAQRSVLTQIFPDYYVSQTQAQFSKYFASLIISKVPHIAVPTYNINIIFHSGASLSLNVAT